ncbi:hypothetical protein [Streptomyces jumonjinensis]|uniref:hypothetical protein n=1 Tax=Streptomyces jumonjinensis TaxID=1945 RepID=UPI0037BAD675
MGALTTLMVLAGQAQAEDIDPTGIGDLMPSPDSKVPEGQGTLYETYNNSNLWRLDSDFGKWDILDPMAQTIADILMAVVATLGTASVVITEWVFQLTTIPPLEDAITDSIGGAAKGLSVTILPAALAFGGLVAFVQHRKDGGGGGLGQIAWVLVSGVVSVSLLSSPGTWVSGVDSARQIGASVTMDATSAGLGDGSGDYPFALGHEPKFTGTGRDDMLRKSSDAVWRAYVATPWCVANFGSFEVCEKYGKELLDQGTSTEKRKEWLQDNVTKDAVGGDSVEWRQGHSPVGRIMVMIPATISVIIFAALIIVLAFTSLASLLGALMLLLTGVIFACLWVIPGRPRQWGLAWFDQLLARTLESLIATMTLGAVLSLQTATMQMFGQYGWLPTTGLSIVAALVGLQFRSVLAQIFGVRGTTSGGALAGFLASRALSRNGSSRKSGSHNYMPVKTLPRPGPGPGGNNLPQLPGGPGSSGPITVSRVPRPRPPMPGPAPAPLPTGPTPGLPPGPTPGLPGPGPGLPSGPSGPPAPTGPTPGGPVPAGPVPSAPSRPTITLDREPPPPLSPPPALPGPSKPRPALPPGSSGGDSTTGTGTPGRAPASPVMRPEAGATPSYAFREAAEPPARGEPKIIKGVVIRSTPNPPPPRPSTPPRPPKTTAAPARSIAPPKG